MAPDENPLFRLTDVQWMNIVNHDHAYAGYSKDDAVHLAVKMTVAKLEEKYAHHAIENTAMKALLAEIRPVLKARREHLEYGAYDGATINESSAQIIRIDAFLVDYETSTKSS